MNRCLINCGCLRDSMMPLRNRPILTSVFAETATFRPEGGSVYVCGTLGEERSAHTSGWDSSSPTVEVVRLSCQSAGHFSIAGVDTNFPLRAGRTLQEFWRNFQRPRVYLDITGLQHHVWAPLLRAAIGAGVETTVVYVEPSNYTFSPAPTEGEIFDLSEQITGIGPLPGFVSLKELPDDNQCFVPLLGFEGIRLAYVLEHVQPPGDRIVPIIGLPGFRAEYAFHAYHGNKNPLLETKCWKNARFAAANCPFSVYWLLEELIGRYAFVKVAPIGTKPHALGAVLYAIGHPGEVELVYDHPIRKRERTHGVQRLLAYHVSEFIRMVSN